MNNAEHTASNSMDAHDLVIEHDTGARNPKGLTGHIMLYTALLWSVFQLWIVSPLQFELGIFILNDTESRSIHLAFALFLAFTAYPAFRSSSRLRIPLVDWLLALAGTFCAAYIFLFYEELSLRPGMATDMDLYVSAAGILILLEATRRALGLPLTMLAAIALAYTFFGNAAWVSDLIAHKGQSLQKVAHHQWLSTEGVFGIALGVSSGFVFLFVLFGALLDKAGAGNYFIKVAFALLGHLRGGPAKAAVLSSALTGFISGSSIANVVTTGTFTIPLMRRVGFNAEKAGAVEVASSVNGQIMPPVMGAAAFIMVEKIGMPYSEIIRHAFLPAVISYIALLYMVHLEALKANMTALDKPLKRRPMQLLLGYGITITSMIILTCLIYYGILAVKNVTGEMSAYAFVAIIITAYVLLMRYATRYPALEQDNPNAELITLPETAPTVKAGLYYMLPIIVLVWSLMVERLSPGLSAFWASVVMMGIVITQPVLEAFFRKHAITTATYRQGFQDLNAGLVAGARNMVGIAIATASAGIIVGTISLTGIGEALVSVVEALANGSLVMVLILTAMMSLILGMGLPTTANYIVVASAMVGVITELGKQYGLVIPPIAAHMFVFYFGIMADVTPPVGLASFAAAAVSKGDPIKTGLQAFIYSIRTAILPFFFVFNNELLLIGVDTIWHGIWVFASATIALLLFSAGLQGYFLVRSRIHESVLLVLVALMLFIPGIFLDVVYPRYETFRGDAFTEVLAGASAGERFKLRVDGVDKLGDPRTYYMHLTVPEGNSAEEKLQALGLEVSEDKGKTVIENIAFGSPMEEADLDFYDEIAQVMKPNQNRPIKYVVYAPAILLLLMVWLLQRQRCAKIFVSH